ncbi:MAG: hypothetical protein ACOH5I_21035 [Oligoflexus sp.]
MQENSLSIQNGEKKLESLLGDFIPPDNVIDIVKLASDRQKPNSKQVDLLTRSFAQWQLGDWGGLTNLTYGLISKHKARGKLALLAAAGHQQFCNYEATKEFASYAKQWGCSSGLVAQVLIAGVHNTLGKIAALKGDSLQTGHHFGGSISPIGPIPDAVKQIADQRQQRQFAASGSHFFKDDPEQIDQINEISDDSMEGNDFRSDHGFDRINVGVHPEYQSSFLQVNCLIGTKRVKLGLNVKGDQILSTTNSQLKYILTAGQVAYLVSNESGNFEDEPVFCQIPLLPDHSYDLKVHLKHTGTETPIIWLFQYRYGARVHSQSHRLQASKFRQVFQTRGDITGFALGIRLAGEGTIDLDASEIQITSKRRSEVNEIQVEELSQLRSSLNNLEKKLETNLQKQFQNSIKQIEAYLSLQVYLGTESIMPIMHGWPISPDLAMSIIRLIESGNYDAGIEFGSGVSTLVIAKAFTKKFQMSKSKAKRLLSFDHLVNYRDTTHQLLEQAGVVEKVELVHAELIEMKGPDTIQYKYYDCDSHLASFRSKLPKRKNKLLVFVDGPPAATGTHARYLALPKIVQVFGKSTSIDILMDDYIRTDEREIIAKWQEFASEIGMSCQKVEFLHLEKQACMLQLRGVKS